MPDPGRPFFISFLAAPNVGKTLDAYLMGLDRLREDDDARPFAQVDDLTLHIRDLRAWCLGHSALHSTFVAVLIGHAELVAQVCRPRRHRDVELRLIDEQSQRARKLRRLADALGQDASAAVELRHPPGRSGSNPTGASG